MKPRLRPITSLKKDKRKRGYSEPLRLDEQTYADLLYGQTDHQQQHEATAKAYCEVFSDLIDEDFEFDLGLVFNDLTSPREYNFETDRLFARMPKESAQKLFQISAEDEHKTLRKVLKDRHSSIRWVHLSLFQLPV